jgi:hypothetical protein
MSTSNKKTFRAETITLPDLIRTPPARSHSGSGPAAGRADQNRLPNRSSENYLSGVEIIHRLIDYFTKS